MAALSGRVAVVTGATSGLGAAIATTFAAAGAHVVLSGRNAATGQALADTLGARFVRADLRANADVENLVTDALGTHGRIDVLVNNGGVPGHQNPVAELDLTEFDDVLAVNLRAPLVAIRAAAPAMIAAGSGSIINVASVSGHRAGYSGHDYSTAKAGLLHLTRTVAVDLARHGVRVNSISPGPIATGIFAAAHGGQHPADGPAPFAGLLPETQPMPRTGLPGDVAGVALFLAGDDSSFVTGQDLTVDGGIAAGRPWAVFERDRATIAAAVQASSG